MHSNYALIQYATIESLTKIFDKNWLKYEEDECLTVKEFHTQLFGALKINEMTINGANDVDRNASNLSVRLQMYCSLISSCFVLRKEIWFRFFDLCCHEIQLKQGQFDM